MRLAQEEHTDTGLADAATDGIGQFLVQDRFLKRQLGAFRTSGFVELANYILEQFIFWDIIPQLIIMLI